MSFSFLTLVSRCFWRERYPNFVSRLVLPSFDQQIKRTIGIYLFILFVQQIKKQSSVDYVTKPPNSLNCISVDKRNASQIDEVNEVWNCLYDKISPSIFTSSVSRPMASMLGD